LFPRNLSNHMDRQARTNDTVLVKNSDREEPNTDVVTGGGGGG
jgi:hypothetical protein